MNKDSELKNIAYKKIKINEKYRFFNSNYDFNDNVIPFFKHNAIVESVKNRIRFSSGASFLITGLRGVGKSTLIKRALNELRHDDISCLPIYINLSKKIEYRELLFEIIRCLYQAIIDNKIMDKIDSEIAKNIVISYSRTSMSISNKNMVNGEFEASTGSIPILGNILLKNKLTRQAAEEASFLAYSANDVEHDLLRIIELLNTNKLLKVKIVIVFDELDKLTVTKNGIECFEDILSKLKSFICSVDAIFIFIGGLDLYQKWNDDVAKINSLYDSIFSWHQYIPCIWNSTESLFALFSEKECIYENVADDFQFMCESKFSNIVKPSFRAFLTYINFKSKGIPRKIYSEFNNFIVWNGETPYFQISEIDIKEICAYTKIWEKIFPIFEDKLYRTVIEMDLTYVTCFNIIEYFFAHSSEEFTIKQIQKALLYESTLSPVSINQIILELMEKFIEQHIIQKNSSNKFIVTDFTIKQEDNIVIKDKALFHESFSEAKFDIRQQNSNFDPDASFKRKIERYESEKIVSFWSCFEGKELILSNAEMSVFYVMNKTNNSVYNAVLYTDKQGKKLQNKNCLYNEATYKLTSKYLLDTTDIISQSYVKTSLREIYNGYLLAHLIDAKIKAKYVMLIIEQLLNFVMELRERGYFNANIKASNIMVNKYLNIKLVDVKNLIRVGSKGVPISALGYASPEMYTDSYDGRSDIYSIGVLLWEMINHKCLNQISFERHIDFQFLSRPRECSEKLWKIIIKATKFNPDERYQTAEEFLKDIYQCKEYKNNKLGIRQDVSIGTVTNLFANKLEKDFSKGVHNDTNEDNFGDYTCHLGASRAETTILNIDSVKSQKAYLVRVVTNEMILIDKAIFKIGKSKGDVELYIGDNKGISRVHAGIINRGKEYYLLDYSSTNKTYLNDIQVSANVETMLENNDVIKLANEKFIFYMV